MTTLGVSVWTYLQRLPGLGSAADPFVLEGNFYGREKSGVPQGREGGVRRSVSVCGLTCKACLAWAMLARWSPGLGASMYALLGEASWLAWWHRCRYRAAPAIQPAMRFRSTDNRLGPPLGPAQCMRKLQKH